MLTLTVRMPTVNIAGWVAALVLGEKQADFGDRVEIDVGGRRRAYWVAGADTLPLSDFPPTVWEVFNQNSVNGLHEQLCRHYGTGLPITVPITLYTLVNTAPERWEFNGHE